MCLSFEEFTVCAGHAVLMEVYGSILSDCEGPQGILDQQLSPRATHLENINIFN